VIVWFREDLRLADQPALTAAVATGQPLILLFIRETRAINARHPGGASNWWLNRSLLSLGAAIVKRGGYLTFRSGNAQDIITAIIAETQATGVFWNRRYDAEGRAIDSALKDHLKVIGVAATSFNGRLLNEPWEITSGNGGWYKVFTPYWKQVQKIYRAPAPLPAPKNLAGPQLASERLEDWALHPAQPDWSAGFNPVWTPGEAGAEARLKAFLGGPVDQYAEHRNRPDLANGTSGLSPHLRFGEISPVRIWRVVKDALAAERIQDQGAHVFLSEIVWREFSYVLLYHNPQLATENYNPAFDHMPWRKDAADYRAWCHGQTGYPIVDAGMRQLWQTGWMHNRVRMIVASFLTKHLLLPWQMGEDWFWDTLVDADPAANAASWQWTAGSGADAAPYFRVFNPITQGQKFDETGDYVRRWCPELAGLPNGVLHEPWQANAATLARAKVILGKTYPKPIITHEAGRAQALAAYDHLKQKRETA
jgi:deoxyribodipyrimidine photo-lyase